MAEKPRLKETDEIFSSIGKGAAKPPPLSAAPEEPEATPAREPAGSLIESLVDGSAEQTPARQSRPQSRRRSRRKEPPDPQRDPRPLDFGKYELPSPRQEEKPAKEKLITPPPAPKMRRINPPSTPREPAREAPRAAESGPESPPPRRGEEAAPQKREMAQEAESRPESPPTRRGEEAAPKKREAPQKAESRPAPSPAPREAAPKKRPPAAEEPEIRPYVFPTLEEAPPLPPPPAREEGPRIVRSASAEQRERRQAAPQPETPPPQPQPQPESQPQPQPQPEPDPEPKPEPKPVTAEDKEKKREEIFQQLSSRFDEAFTQAFEGKLDEPRRITPKGRARSPYTFEVPPEEENDLPMPEPDFQAEREADSFLEEFQQQVEQEEEIRTEIFKDTLAEKFERERERYLKELGIDSPQEEPEPEEATPFQPPATRRLDVQIDPEMHRAYGEDESKKPARPRQTPGAAAGPVTYSRSGAVRPLDQEPEPDPEPEPPSVWAPRRQEHRGRQPEPDGRRSAEELLLELGRQSQNPVQQPASVRPPPRPRETAGAAAAKAQGLQFVAPTEEKKPEKTGRKQSRRIIAISAVAAVLLLVVFAVPFLANLLPAAEAPGNAPSSPEQAGSAGDLIVYENRNPDTREEYDNIIIRKPNVTVRNFAVAGNLLIQDIEAQGSVRLEDITVDGEIRLNSGGVESLVLRNVSANRLVINNGSALVKVELGGYGIIETAELRSSASIGYTPSQGAEGGESINNVILRAAPEVSVLNVTLSGLELQSVTAGPGSVLELGADTVVEHLTGEGALSLSGSGKIRQMSAAPADLAETLVLNLGVPVDSLTMRGKAQLSLDGHMDKLVTSENLSLSGSGSVANLYLDVPVSGHRLSLEVDGVSVYSLVANTETTLRATGAARVMEIVANESVYALGNKVNTLHVNANDVIYESEPDKIVTTAGIRPPGIASDYPNLDLYAGTGEGAAPPDTDLDDVSTVCGHTRESGGFLKGDGSAVDPYQVATPAQLAHIQLHLNSHFYQTGDIDIADDTQFVSGFSMIASQGSPFTGSYDGGGYGIYGLKISSGSENVGLFAENTGALRNIAIRSGEVRGSSADRSFVGGVVGLNYQSGTVSSCSNEARVIGSESAYVGGICGYNYSAKIRDCYNAAKITGSSNVGGVAGVNGDGASLSGSYNVGTIEGSETATGAVVGTNASGGVVTNCYYLTETAPVGIGSGSGTAAERNTDELSAAQMVADLSAGSDTSPWIKSEGSYTYPLLRAPDAPDFPGTQSQGAQPQPLEQPSRPEEPAAP